VTHRQYDDLTPYEKARVDEIVADLLRQWSAQAAEEWARDRAVEAERLALETE
jgi:hypothetical protein